MSLSEKTQQLKEQIRKRSAERMKERFGKEATDQLFMTKGIIAAFTDELARMPGEIVEVFTSALQEIERADESKTLDRLDLLIAGFREMEKQLGVLSSQKDVRITNPEDLPQTKSVAINNLKDLPAPVLQFPETIQAEILKQVDVMQIEANKTTFERNQLGQITQIVETYNKFEVVHTFTRNVQTGTLLSITKRIR